MTPASQLTESQQRMLVAILLRYRAAGPITEHGSFKTFIQFEKELAAKTLREMETILNQSQPATHDCEVLAAVERFRQKALTA